MNYYDCDKCDYYQGVNLIQRVYLLDDDNTFRMLQRFIWCNNCDEISVAESFTEYHEDKKFRLETMNRYREEIDNGDDENMIEFKKESLIDLSKYEKQLTKIQEKRTRKQYCLKCGNEDIVIPESNYSDLNHEECGGILKCSYSIEQGCSIPPVPHKYNFNGELIERGFRSSPFRDEPSSNLELFYKSSFSKEQDMLAPWVRKHKSKVDRIKAIQEKWEKGILARGEYEWFLRIVNELDK